jgi:hypothetical protein
MRLAPIDPRAVDDEQLLDLVSAEWRQLAYQQARVWTVFAELAVRVPSVPLPGGRYWSADRVFDNAVDELRAELVLTRRAAGTELATAARVAGLGPVLAALVAGQLDRGRAIALADGCWDLTPAQTDKLLAEVLPVAARVTLSGLSDKIRRVASALDPDWAHRRYRQAVRERKVVGYLNADGSATLAGQNLPAEDAALAAARVDALADAAKRAGAAAKIDHLRAEVFLGLLDGRWTGQHSAAIIADLLRQYPKPPRPDEPPDEPPDDPPAQRSADEVPAEGVGASGEALGGDQPTPRGAAFVPAAPVVPAASPPAAAGAATRSTATSTTAPTPATLEPEPSEAADSPAASAATIIRTGRAAGPHQPRQQPAATAAHQRKSRARRTRRRADWRRLPSSRPARPPP